MMSHHEAHLVQEVELGDVGGLCVQQLIGNVEDPLLDRQLRDRQEQTDRETVQPQRMLNSCLMFLFSFLLNLPPTLPTMHFTG